MSINQPLSELTSHNLWLLRDFFNLLRLKMSNYAQSYSSLMYSVMKLIRVMILSTLPGKLKILRCKKVFRKENNS